MNKLFHQPDRDADAALRQAHLNLLAAQWNPDVAHFAGPELQRAAAAVHQADEAQAEHQDAADVDRLAHLGSDRVKLAQDTAAGHSPPAAPAAPEAPAAPADAGAIPVPTVDASP